MERREESPHRALLYSQSWAVMSAASGMMTLQAMFPDVEAKVAEAVLAQCHGNLESAVDGLLSMTNPANSPAHATVLPPQAHLINTSGDDEAGQTAVGDDELASQYEAEERLRHQQYQLLEDEMLAHQLDQDEQLALELQQQLLMEDHEAQGGMALRRQQYQQSQLFTGNQDRNAAFNDARVHRPSQWGANGTTHPRPEQQGSGVGESIYNAGAAVASGVGSFFSWAVGSVDDSAIRKRNDVDGPGGSRRKPTGVGVPSMREIPLQEMMPMPRAPEVPGTDGVGGGRSDVRRVGSSHGHTSTRGSRVEHDVLPTEMHDCGSSVEALEGLIEGRIVQLDSRTTNLSHSLSYGAGSEVRRRAPRQPATSTHENDLL